MHPVDCCRAPCICMAGAERRRRQAIRNRHNCGSAFRPMAKGVGRAGRREDAMNETVVAPRADAAPVVTIGANFSGPQFHTDPGIAASPPDTDGAVGPNSFVELLNNLYQVYDKSG